MPGIKHNATLALVSPAIHSYKVAGEARSGTTKRTQAGSVTRREALARYLPYAEEWSGASDKDW